VSTGLLHANEFAMKPALPKSVQEHLGRELRTALHEGQPSPAYVGDPALPPAFDEYLRRLALLPQSREGERARSQGLAAVEAALQDVGGRAGQHGLDAVRSALQRSVAAMRLPRGK
jgi:hypothetical protein